MKTYLLKKGSSIEIIEHSWGGMLEHCTPKINTTLDEDIIIKCEDYNLEKNLYKKLRKKYNLQKTQYNSFIYKSLLNQVQEL